MNILQNMFNKNYLALFCVLGLFLVAIAVSQLVPVSPSFSQDGDFVLKTQIASASHGGDGWSACCSGGDNKTKNNRDRDNDNDPKPSCDISASPKNIQLGGSSNLFWDSSNTSSASLDQGIGSVPKDGSFVVFPTVTTKYTLTVRSSEGTRTCNTTVTVQTPPPPPPSCTIFADPSSIEQGGSSTLVWSSSNASSASINRGIGGVTLNGSLGVTPNQTKTYTMTVTGPGGTANCQTIIVVTEIPNEPWCTISANPSSIAHGNSSTLVWSSSNATTASIDHGVGSVSLSGSRSVTPGSTITYTMTVTGAGGTADCQTTVVVTQQQVPSCTISANPNSIQRGGSSYLTWSSSNATSATLSTFGSVNTNGNRTVFPNNTTTYILTVQNSQGQSASCQRTVHVDSIPNQRPSCWINLTPQNYGGSYNNYNQYNNNNNNYYYNQATLSWGSQNATSAYVSPNVGPVSVYGSRQVNYSGYGVYTMTVYGQGGTATCQTQYTQTPPPPPPPVYPPQVTLTQIPYTGLDLGAGMILYYFSILAFVASAGYLAVYYLPIFARVKAHVPAVAMEAPMQFAKSVADSARATQDSMAFMRSKDGSTPQIVIARS